MSGVTKLDMRRPHVLTFKHPNPFTCSYPKLGLTRFPAMIKLLIPDLPRTRQLTPWLKKIEEQRWYTNFGPLVEEFERKLEDLVPSAVASDTKLLSVASGTAALELGVEVTKPSKRCKSPAAVI